MGLVEPVLKFNVSALHAAHAELLQRIESKQKSLDDMAGFPVGVGSAKSLQVLFFEKCGMKPQKVNLKSSRASFSKDVIRNYDTPYTPLVLDLKTLYAIEKYFRIAEKFMGEDGYIHYQLVDSVTGRLYADEPNVISFPAEIRGCVIPEEGNSFIGADFINEELAIIAHLVGCTQLIADIKSGKDVFTSLAEEFQIPRDDIKLSIYAFQYGSNYNSIATKINKDVAFVEQLFNKLYSKYPELKRWMAVAGAVKEAGSAKTIAGNTYTIDPNFPDQDKEVRRAVNFMVQGSAAEILRELLKWCQEESIMVRVCSHDYVLVEVQDGFINDVKDRLSRKMSSFLNGALSAKILVGKTWRQAWEEEEIEDEG